VYAAEVDGQRLTFEVDCVWRRNMVIRDRETGSLWQHATGEAVAGPLQGKMLTLLGGQLTTWGGWQAAHPYTLAAQDPEEWGGRLSKAKVTKVLDTVTSFATAPGLTKPDRRLPSHEVVIGIMIDGIARAYPLETLIELGVIDDEIEGEQIRLEYDPTHDAVRATMNDAPINAARTWWTGWYEFHPETTLFEPVNI
jgi:hypothetical protein